MPRFSFASLRFRLTLLVILAVLPALGLTLYAYIEQRRLQRTHVREQALLLTRVVTSYEERLIEGARQLLTALAQLPQVRGGDPAVCNAFFTNLLKKYPLYANLGAVERNGNVFCSALPTKPFDLSDRPWFQRAIKKRIFAVGEYQFGRISRKPVIVFGYPVLDAADKVSVVFASLDLAWLNQLVAKVKLPKGASVIVVDRNGTILARHPDPEKWVGKSVPDAPIVKAILAQGKGVTEVYDADGIPRLYAFTLLDNSSPDANVYIGVGLSEVDPFAEADRTLIRNLMGLGLVAILVLAIVWLGGDRFILRWVRSLTKISRQLAAGDLSARHGLPYGPGELSQLAHAFDEMAESLERQLTERQRAEAELRRANDRFGLAAAAVNSIIYDWDVEKNTVERTHGLIDVLGYRQEETEPILDWWIDRVHPNDQQHVRDQISVALANDSVFVTEYRLRNKDNQYLYVWDRGLIVRNADGHAVRVVGSILDITERKQAEEALRESEERFRQIAENIREVLWMATPDGSQMIYVNSVYEEMWGCTCESLYEQPRSFLNGIHSQDRDRVIAAFEKQIQGDYNEEYQIVRPDSSVRWVRSRAFPIRNQAGQIYRVLGLVEDITDRKHAEAEIRQLNETLEQRVQERTAQLEAANRELDAFSYSVSHDLRAPLRHIRGFVDALAKNLEHSGAIADPRTAHYIEVIQDSSQKMGQLIDGLLTLSRVGRRQLANQPVNLRQLVDTAIAFVISQTEIGEEPPIQFTIGDLPTMMGDPTLLQQVFSNLIDNAVKFSRDRYPATIEIGSLPDETIFVKDNGVGFQMEYADQLFGAFQRLHSQREFKGMGIGLAIVQRIIHRHGGTIWAESAPNQGATFYFKLRSEASDVASLTAKDTRKYQREQ